MQDKQNRLITKNRACKTCNKNTQANIGDNTNGSKY